MLLLREAGNCPYLHLYARMKLLAAHIPNSLIWQRRHLHSAAVQKLWRCENAALNFGHLAFYRDAEFLCERIERELGAAH